jgi:epoxyqueuosine reductase
MPTPETAVRAHAQTLFDAVRFTTPEAPAHGEFVKAWLKAGMHGEMGYLEKRNELRSGQLDREELLAGAETVIVVAVSYDFPYPTNGVNSKANKGVVARYARGEDYHAVLWEKLNALSAYLKGEFGATSRGFTDSGPIRERELARRAGLGWQGKHTNLISLDLGNFFFLGALLTTLKLTPDEPFDAHHCGTCTSCLSACPTGALVAPMVLDARRCISYLTIELKGSIPLEMRHLIGDRIFGCDDCLAACPWNDKARAGTEMRLAARDHEDAAFPDLLAWLAITETDEQFKTKFAGTPILRTGRVGLRRNICVALGNVGTIECVPILEKVRATDPSEIVQEHAQWAITMVRTNAGQSSEGFVEWEKQTGNGRSN